MTAEDIAIDRLISRLPARTPEEAALMRPYRKICEWIADLDSDFVATQLALDAATRPRVGSPRRRRYVTI